MRGISTVPTYVVMQPRPLCTLDCSYCYLPFRRDDRQMPVEVAGAVAASVNGWARTGRFSVVWHGGEPLAAGRDHLAALLSPLDPAGEHPVQTHPTPIDDGGGGVFAQQRERGSGRGRR